MRIKALLTAIITAAALSSCASEPAVSDSSITETAAPVTEAAEEITTQAEEQVNPAIGTWIMHDTDTDTDTELLIESDNAAYMRVTLDITDHFCFDKDRNFISKGQTIPADRYEMKNGRFSYVYKDKPALKMRKTDGVDDVLGEYLLTACQYKDKVKETLDTDEISGIDIVDDRITVIAEENRTSLLLLDEIDSFELKDDVMVTDIYADGTLLESPYEVDGDTMTITNSVGEKNTYQRKK
ncbi:MAG: hypothetical protein J5501_02210 [Ruminococcus sp.]|nr:hypothetical protein [Ruminococcus sp.]